MGSGILLNPWIGQDNTLVLCWSTIEPFLSPWSISPPFCGPFRPWSHHWLCFGLGSASHYGPQRPGDPAPRPRLAPPQLLGNLCAQRPFWARSTERPWACFPALMSRIPWAYSFAPRGNAGTIVTIAFAACKPLPFLALLSFWNRKCLGLVEFAESSQIALSVSCAFVLFKWCHFCSRSYY